MRIVGKLIKNYEILRKFKQLHDLYIFFSTNQQFLISFRLLKTFWLHQNTSESFREISGKLRGRVLRCF